MCNGILTRNSIWNTHIPRLDCVLNDGIWPWLGYPHAYLNASCKESPPPWHSTLHLPFEWIFNSKLATLIITNFVSYVPYYSFKNYKTVCITHCHIQHNGLPQQILLRDEAIMGNRWDQTASVVNLKNQPCGQSNPQLVPDWQFVTLHYSFPDEQ
jgi:hypothetical protein